jgi:hypothetical protein
MAKGKVDVGCCPAVPIGRLGAKKDAPGGTVTEAEELVVAMREDGSGHG